MVEVDDVTNGDGAEEVVVAHVGIAGLHQLVLVVQYLGKMKEIRELLRKRTAVLFPHPYPGTNLGLGWGESVPLEKASYQNEKTCLTLIIIIILNLLKLFYPR